MGRFSKLVGMTMILALVLLAGTFMVYLLEEASRSGMQNVILGMVALGGMSWVVFRGPVGKAIAAMLDSPAAREGDAFLSARVADLEDRLQELSLEAQRMGELEERLDFAERLLARQSTTSTEGE